MREHRGQHTSSCISCERYREAINRLREKYGMSLREAVDAMRDVRIEMVTVDFTTKGGDVIERDLLRLYIGDGWVGHYECVRCCVARLMFFIKEGC
jgi:hypothetical protein